MNKQSAEAKALQANSMKIDVKVLVHVVQMTSEEPSPAALKCLAAQLALRGHTELSASSHPDDWLRSKCEGDQKPLKLKKSDHMLVAEFSAASVPMNQFFKPRSRTKRGTKRKQPLDPNSLGGALAMMQRNSNRALAAFRGGGGGAAPVAPQASKPQGARRSTSPRRTCTRSCTTSSRSSGRFWWRGGNAEARGLERNLGPQPGNLAHAPSLEVTLHHAKGAII